MSAPRGTPIVRIPANSDTYRIPEVAQQQSWAARLRELAAAMLVLR